MASKKFVKEEEMSEAEVSRLWQDQGFRMTPRGLYDYAMGDNAAGQVRWTRFGLMYALYLCVACALLARSLNGAFTMVAIAYCWSMGLRCARARACVCVRTSWKLR